MKASILTTAILLLSLHPPAEAATATWLGGSGNWDDPLKWSTGAVPGSTDDVVLDFTSVALQEIALATAFSVDDLTVTGNRFRLFGAGKLDVLGSFQVTNPDELIIEGAGQFHLHGACTLGGSFDELLRPTLNDGIFETPGTPLYLGDFDNRTGATFRVAGSPLMVVEYDKAFTNRAGAVFEVNDASSGFIAGNFHNAGTFRLTNPQMNPLPPGGGLQMGGGSQPSTWAGTVDVQTGTRLNHSGFFRVVDNLEIMGGGEVLLSSGILEIADGKTLQVKTGTTLDLGMSSYFTSDGSIEIAGTVRMDSLYQYGADNPMRVLSGGLLHQKQTDGSPVPFSQFNSSLVNHGTVRVEDGALILSGDSAAEQNTGLYRTDAGGHLVFSGVFELDGATFQNDGRISVMSGTVDFQANDPITLTGDFGGDGGGFSSSGSITHSSGTIAPGFEDGFEDGQPFNDQPAGTLIIGTSFLLSASSVLEFDLGTSQDWLFVFGDLTLDGALDVNPLAGFAAGTYTLIDYTGLLTDNGLTLGTLPGGGYTYALENDLAQTKVNLVVSAVPEPSTALLLGAAGLGLLLRRRR